MGPQEKHGCMKRDMLLDILKGIGMLIVVIGHTYHGQLTHFIYTFHMPLFFIASGCIFALGKGGTIKGKIKSIVVPYISFSMLCYLYWWLIESKMRGLPDCNPFDAWMIGVSGQLQQLINILLSMDGCHAFEYNVALWFLPCIFVSYLIYIPLSHCKSVVQLRGVFWQ